MTPEQLVLAARRQQLTARAGLGGGADTTPSRELGLFIDGVVSGRVYAAPLPWPVLHNLTQALLPGTITVVCGDPGVGKTFLILDCLRHWAANGVDAAVFFVEKNRTFYLRRLLAQLGGKSDFIDLNWWHRNADAVRMAMAQHRATLDELGGRMRVEGVGARVTLRSLYAWIEDELRSGRRVVAIDPITAAHAGPDRWEADDWFVVETQKLLSRYGASLVLVTHPRKGNVTQKSGHDMAAGAAYFRFSDTTLWINRLKRGKRFDVYGLHGPSTVETHTVIQIHKAREGKGTGQDVAMSFGEGLTFAEYGTILRESKDDADDGDAGGGPMTTAELTRAIRKLTATFPTQIVGDAQKAAVRTAFAPHGLRAVEVAIETHFAAHGKTLHLPALLEQLRNSQ